MIPLSSWGENAKYFDIFGARIAYWVEGSLSQNKPWLLLIHGYPTSSWDWTAMWPQLAARFNLVALDMLGFGLSHKPSDIQYSVIQQAALHEALLQKLDIQKAHILAHDYGVSVAQELIARDQDDDLGFDLQSVCFLNGGLFPEQHRLRLVQKIGISPFGALLGLVINRSTFGKSLSDVFGAATKPSPSELDSHWALVCERNGHKIQHKLLHYIQDRKTNRARWVGGLKATKIPMRLINGALDPVSGEHLFHYYNEQIPNADAVLLKEIGHYPQTEDPNSVMEAFGAFHARLPQIYPMIS